MQDAVRLQKKRAIEKNACAGNKEADEKSALQDETRESCVSRKQRRELRQQGEWRALSPEQKQIMALEANVEQLKDSLLKPDKNTQKDKDIDKNNLEQTEDSFCPPWHTKKPKDRNTKHTWNGKPIGWFSHHKH